MSFTVQKKNTHTSQMTLEMKKTLFALTLLTLCSCGTNKIHESQGRCEYEWLSGSIGLPLSWISTDTLVTPPLADEFTDYPQQYSEEIKCIYHNGKYAVRIGADLILIPQDTTNEIINDKRFYVHPPLHGCHEKENISYAMTYLPKEKRNRYYILNTDFDIAEFKHDSVYRERIIQENITAFDNREHFEDELKKRDVKPIFERVYGWDPEPDRISTMQELERGIRDRIYNVTSFYSHENRIYRHIHGGFFYTGIAVPNKFFKQIDDKGIIDYSSDTIYIFDETIIEEDEFDWKKDDYHRVIYLKNKNGILKIPTSTEDAGSGIKSAELPKNASRKAKKYYNGVFEWGNLRDFILKNWDPRNRAEARLKRIIIKDYRIEYMDFWKFEGIGMHILPE